MTFPSAAGPADDPDPTTQMPWPTRIKSNNTPPSGIAQTVASGGTSPTRNDDIKKGDDSDDENEIGRKQLSTLQLFNLSISMAGSQVAWTVELG